MEGHANRWVKVSHGEPCPVCQRSDWCTRTADGECVKCMRVESERPVETGGWVHRLDQPLPDVVIDPREEQKIPVDAEAEARRMYLSDAAVEMRRTVAKELGLLEGVLDWLRVGAGWDDYRNVMFSSWPQRDERGKIVGLSRRYPDGTKRTMKGTHGGLSYVLKLWQVGTGPIYLPEGGSDTAALVGIGACAIGRPSNTGGIAMLAKMLGKVNRRIVVLGERDEKQERKGELPTCPDDCRGCLHCYPGAVGAAHTTRQLRKRLKTKVDFRLLPAKDARAFVNGGACLFDLLKETR